MKSWRRLNLDATKDFFLLSIYLLANVRGLSVNRSIKISKAKRDTWKGKKWCSCRRQGFHIQRSNRNLPTSIINSSFRGSDDLRLAQQEGDQTSHWIDRSFDR